MASPKILGYTTGPLPVTSAFTSAFTMHADDYGNSLQSFLNFLELDRRAMMDYDSDTRASLAETGMYLKYVPARISSSSSSSSSSSPNNEILLTGGAYLFTTPQARDAFAHWTTHTYHDPTTGVLFWDRPFFRDARRWSWDVVGAHNFAPPARHALSRVQHYSYAIDAEGEEEDGRSSSSTDVAHALKEIYPALLAAAREQTATAAFWLLHAPSERLVATHLVGERVEGEGADEAVARMEALPSMLIEEAQQRSSTAAAFPVLTGLERVFDRTSLFVQNWLPVSRAAGGVPADTPNFPDLPRVAVEE
ncbi:uncharacterized protein BKCO1_2000206 [Diplodia corticola]|uniref:Uncharacterized protein n=1 Tax=Diplodia corticola TaxID=236234 RepID=A0A1J9RIM4_9PEZI|nr:uncharacterized protein BKCO1_2000206 [Diplodia corticola]OJD39874.1 hypothetical protein BKCO1_2000206 [Diplodia corticola]